MKHNNVIQNSHFKKEWQLRVRTWFNQPGRKQRRRIARTQKAIDVAPRPVDGLLRPVVRCPTKRYNIRVRSGRGFSLEELKAASINARQARTIGIAVDHRRRNKSVQSLERNVLRLKEYKQKLILFPINAAKPQIGDTTDKEVLAKVSQLGAGELMPFKETSELETMSKSDITQKGSVFDDLRRERADRRLFGVREKKGREQAEAAEEEKRRKRK